MELAALGKVSILVPLPWSAAGEQLKNADWLARRGGAVVLTQSELTPQLLKKEINTTWENMPLLQQRASALAIQIPRDGTQRFVHEIEYLLSAP